MYRTPLQLQDIPLDEALERWSSELEFQRVTNLCGTEQIPVYEAPGRMTAAPQVARVASPHYYSAAIDGLAVRTTQTFGATPETPVRLRLGPDAAFVDTSSAMPEGLDAVVPVHEVHFVSAEEVEVRNPAAPWQNVRPTGEDLAVDEVILPAAHRILPMEVGSMLAGGVTTVTVRRKPSFAIIPVGSNLVRAGSNLAVGQSIECNSFILQATIEQWGGNGLVLDIVPERRDDVVEVVRRAVEQHDAIVLIAGVSHGTALLASVLQELGDMVLYGVSIKPGRSAVLGLIKGKPVLGLPAHAVSGFVAFDVFARPVMGALLGTRAPRRVRSAATLAREVGSAAGVDELLRVNLGQVGDRLVALPISRGAGILMSLVRADGLLRVPAEVETLPQGTRVDVELFNPTADFTNHLLAIGTHDIVYDVLRNDLMKRFPDIALRSSNVGSMKGLKALVRGLAHVAGLHLFDEATGEYNVPFVERENEGMALVLVNLFSRHLGLIVRAGNPKNIQSVEDLKRPDVTFINRQMGSGTRKLIDYHLHKHGVDGTKVRGYERETYTHMSLASTIASGNADVGLGLAAVAKALHLDFIPAVPERFDLAIPRRIMGSHIIRCLLQVLKSESFKQEVESLHGYDTRMTGTVIGETAGDR
jgi:putative molybdopterin biosynthesis protein